MYDMYKLHLQNTSIMYIVYLRCVVNVVKRLYYKVVTVRTTEKQQA